MLPSPLFSLVQKQTADVLHMRLKAQQNALWLSNQVMIISMASQPFNLVLNNTQWILLAMLSLLLLRVDDSLLPEVMQNILLKC